MNINFVMKRLEHITSAGIQQIKMESNKIDATPPILAYIEKYASENGFTLLNGVAAGPNIQLFLVKQ